ncbi:DinB family protein [Metabacillus endolithicus]|uniref:DinB family protein n=1 Tax=Metabacillus endolithicus TaxID=1535204 RepID=A0ABW5C372_9BACI|nr:DinB family protein [Metabacillus endolithicus]UPG62100.1 DinB family protein [Metabacillus endolithicus]
MRSTADGLQVFEKSVERYLLELEDITMEQLLAAPNDEEWSIGQLFVHLIQSAHYMLHNIEQCLAGGDDVTGVTKGKTEDGKALFELGSFPPIRIKVPASSYTTPQPEGKEHLIEGLRDVVERMKRIERALNQAPNGDKIIHPKFGALNATEWFLLVEMHFRHHFLQLERLLNVLEK